MYVNRSGNSFNFIIRPICGSSFCAAINCLTVTSPDVIIFVACAKSVYVITGFFVVTILLELTGRTTPSVLHGVTLGSLTFLFATVFGVFLISRRPVFAFVGAFFLAGIGLSKESASSNHFTSSDVKCLPCGIVNRRKISSVCFSVSTCLLFSSDTISFKFL